MYLVYANYQGMKALESYNLDNQVAEIEATLEATSNTPCPSLHKMSPLYFENPITSFSTLTSFFVSNTVALQDIFQGKKLNDQNYFSWSQFVKMALKGCHKFGFLTGEISRPPPGDPHK